MSEYKPNVKIPCVYMRGGTSKAVFFHDKDLPQDVEQRDKVILSAFGSPDRRQIDGMGGANTSTSKVAIIKKSSRPGIDVDYDFGQVDIAAPIVGKTMNCGNISSAVGPFAIDEGLVEAVEPITEVHIFNTNTQKEIIAQVPVKDGRAMTEGDFAIDGVPGTGAKVTLKFVGPQGAASGKLLPTGNVKDTIEIDGKEYEYSFVDAANPVIFVHPKDFGVTGTETPAQFNALPDCQEICRKLEIIRGTGAIILGFAKDLEDAKKNSQTLPKIAFCHQARQLYCRQWNGNPCRRYRHCGTPFLRQHEDDRRLHGNRRHLHRYRCQYSRYHCQRNHLRQRQDPPTAHPTFASATRGGIMDAYADLKENEDGTHTVLSGNLDRTARRIMEGYVYVRV